MKRTNINLREEDVQAIALIRQHYGLENDASAIRFAIRQVAREIMQHVPRQTGEHRQNGTTR
jgi:sulfur relay (sulfurtransferase) DsrC/TusE family protein